MIVCVPETAQLASSAVALASDCKAIQMGFGSCGNDVKDIRSLAKAVQDPKKSCPAPFYPPDPTKHKAIIFWSSGTTGVPKGIAHSHSSLYNLFCIPDWQKEWMPWLSSLAFYHIGGFYSGCQAITYGATLHHVRKKDC